MSGVLRVAAISLGLLLLLTALTMVIVFGGRRSFPANEQIVYESDYPNSLNRPVSTIHPNSSFGENDRTLFYPNTISYSPLISGMDCAPDSRSLIFWYLFLYRYDLESKTFIKLLQGQGIGQISAWSPDETRIAYTDAVAHRQPPEIFVASADGSGKTQITTTPHDQTSLSWSPDGKRIAYTYLNLADATQSGIAIVAAAGGAEATIYQTTAKLSNVAWSPDGSRLAFDMNTDTRTDIYTIQPDGSALTRLTNAAAQNILPHWSPDGALISFSARDAGGYYQLYVMNADGSDPYLVIREPGASNRNLFNLCWLETP